MTTHNISILYVIANNRKRTDNKAPIFCRITYQKKRKQFASGIFINPKNWDNKHQKIKPPEEDYKTYNTSLSLIKTKINQAFLFLQMKGDHFIVDDIYLQYTGENSTEEKSIITLFSEHNKKVEKLVGKDYAIGTLWKFNQSLELLQSFVKHHYKKNDYQFKNLDLKFIQDYEFYLKTEKSLGQATINKAIQRFRRIVRIAISEKIITHDPFTLYKVKREKKEVIYLSENELKAVEEYDFSQIRLEQVRDMFVFCCYTGLAYNEMARLNAKNIEVGFDGMKWIKMIRVKTQKLISVPLLPKAISIIDKHQDDKHLLPVISNQKFNSYLKEIADITGIKKNLTHHVARKTFATTVLLYNDVPMEIVSELLGHSKMSITQEHYGKVVQKKVSEHMQNLTKKLKGSE